MLRSSPRRSRPRSGSPGGPRRTPASPDPVVNRRARDFRPVPSLVFDSLGASRSLRGSMNTNRDESNREGDDRSLRPGGAEEYPSQHPLNITKGPMGVASGDEL